VDAPFNLVDLQTAAQRPLSGAPHEINSTRQLVWSPDGTRFVLVDLDSRNQRLLRYAAPAWQPEAIADQLTWPAEVQWSPDGRSLVAFGFDPDGNMVVQKMAEAGQDPIKTVVPMGTPPAGYR
jgi:glucose/arabinose dehydrogenase